MKEFFSRFRDSLAARTCLWTLFLLLAGAGTAFAQPTVGGTVTDEQGNPLVGVTVVVVDSNKGTTTDINGNYSIAVPKGGILEFTYIGMSSQRIPCGGGFPTLTLR